MDGINISAFLVAIGLALGNPAMAQNMSPDDYKLQGKRIEAQFKSDKELCGALAGNAKDKCLRDAEARFGKN